MFLSAVQNGAASSPSPATKVLLVVAVVATLLYFIPYRDWRRAKRHGLSMGLGELANMRLRRMKTRSMVDVMIAAKELGLDDIEPIDILAHKRQGGHVIRVMNALRIAQEANYDLTFDRACEIDLQNRHVVAEVEDIIRARQENDEI